MKLNRKLALGSAALVISGLALTGCGASGGSGDGSKDSVSWMAILHTPTTPEKGGTIEVALEDLVGEDLNFQWIPDASKDEKLNAAIASDTLADIVSLPGVTNSTIRRSLAAGQFWDIEPYLSEFPNLAAIDPQIIEGAKIDGHLYGVPAQKPKARFGVLVRQDWLDNLGLEVPHTTEEIAEVARAFTTQDPDGNGKDDTTGIVDRSESFDLTIRTLAGYFGAGSDFELNDDGEVVASFATDAFVEAMEWYHDLYVDGAVTQEFVTVQKQNQQDAIAQGKGGIVVTGLFDAKNYMALAQSSDPETPMSWAIVNDVTHDDVPRRIVSDTNGGLGGWYAISKSSVKTEDELKVVLGVLDKLLTEEGFGLMTNGIEGEHFEYEDDGAVTILDQTRWEQEVQPFSSSRLSETIKVFPSTTEYVNEATEKMAENDEYTITNVAQSLTSETFDSRWTEVLQQARDTYNKYMVGQLELSDYEKLIEDLRAGDLGKIEAEFTAAYDEVNG
ncbi:sugar ABC transporter substrate-binding protein [Microbacterium sorbitolivorans]|uniref:Extracellular solute-binding protein n=1 Tax=Microbacterium sorbitolivorans TaxID=1867410 RepID=A0A367Y8E9_9MICO|nr:extracellular solute-binding protein [Microbacterium sorbitolivorans]RCK62087.1 extracellular solute-binding protein [Microbacterium sorbitolivorans]GGF43317.1 sugar ABC transporter substrate-binding protein [Microbacterium sorbitolivorans]